MRRQSSAWRRASAPARGTMQGVCGALVGAVMLAGLSRSTAHLEHSDSKPQTAALARTLMKAFEQEAGAVYCKDLKGVATGKPLLSCHDCVRLACRLHVPRNHG